MLSFIEYLKEQLLNEGGGTDMFKAPSAGKPIEIHPVSKDRTGNLTGEPVGIEHRQGIHKSLEIFGKAVASRTGQNPFGENGIRYGGSSGPIMDPETTEEDTNRWKKDHFNDIDVHTIHAHEDGSELQEHLHNMFNHDGKDNRFGDLELKSMTKHGGTLGKGTAITSALFHHHPTGRHIQVDFLHTPKGPKGEAMDPGVIAGSSSKIEDMNHNIKGAHKNALAESVTSVLGGSHPENVNLISDKSGKSLKRPEDGLKKMSLSAGRVWERYKPFKHEESGNKGLIPAGTEGRQHELKRGGGKLFHHWLNKKLGINLPEDPSFVKIHKALHEGLKSGLITRDHMNEIRNRYNAKIAEKNKKNKTSDGKIKYREGIFEERDAAVKGKK